MSFTHLHVATAFSALHGTSLPGELAAEAARHGATALACTDRDGLYGAVPHVRACLASGLSPILGVDLAVLDDQEDGARRRVSGRVVVLAHGGGSPGSGSPESPGAGYRALCRLVSDAHAQGTGRTGDRPPVGVTRKELAARAVDPDSGLPVLTILLGPESDVGLAMHGRRYLRPRTLFKEWLTAMPTGTVTANVVSHLTRPEQPGNTGHAVRMLKLAREHHVPAVLSNAVRAASPEDSARADVLDAARALIPPTNLPGGGPGRLHPPAALLSGQAYLKSPAEMDQVAREIGYAADLRVKDLAQLVQDTERLAGICRLDPVADLGWNRSHLPEASVLGFAQDPQTELVQRCLAAVGRRFPGRPDATLQVVGERMRQELDIIEELGFAGFFLTVAEVSGLAADLGIRAVGQGSGVASMVNHLLGISPVDPLRHGLLFERFLGDRRSREAELLHALPDLTLDVEPARRHHLYQAVFRRFGKDRVALVGTQSVQRPGGSAPGVDFPPEPGLTLGLNAQEVESLARQLRRLSPAGFHEGTPAAPELRDFAARVLECREHEAGPQPDLLTGLPGHADALAEAGPGNPCGVILGNATLLDRTPVQPGRSGLPLSQFDKRDMGSLGLLTLELRGSRMQGVIAHTVREVHRLHPTADEVATAGHHSAGENRGVPDFIHEDGLLDIDAIPLEDGPGYELIRSTHTLGCFPVESAAQRDLVGVMAPRGFTDLLVDLALFGPRRLEGDLIRTFLERRQDRAAAEGIHPSLRPTLEETCGLPLFDEQVMRIFDIMTGCGASVADQFRRALVDPRHQPRLKEHFRQSALQKGHSPELVGEAWEMLSSRGHAGFSKAHGVAFALPSHQSAWLKARHPEAFLAGLWEHEASSHPRELLLAEARRLGVPVLPVDVNHSDEECHVERSGPGQGAGRLGVRLSLKGVPGLSEAERKRLIACRPYATLDELRTRAKVSPGTLRRLAAQGALDSLHRAPDGQTGHSELVRSLQELTARPAGAPRAQVEGQLTLPQLLGDEGDEGDAQLPAGTRTLPRRLPLSARAAGF